MKHDEFMLLTEDSGNTRRCHPGACRIVFFLDYKGVGINLFGSLQVHMGETPPQGWTHWPLGTSFPGLFSRIALGFLFPPILWIVTVHHV